MVNNNVRSIVDAVMVANSQPKTQEELYVFIQQVANHLVKDCVSFCMEDYKNQGNYGAGFRLAKEIEGKFLP